jgi:exosortase/archaeosortase family protein
VALCLGAILAYPVPWRYRLSGAAAGLAAILALNTLRIGTLGRAVASPRWFETLHVYIWPAALTLAIAALVFGWMRFADARHGGAAGTDRGPYPSRRFLGFTIAFVLLFSAVSPLYLESANVLALAGVIAGTAAAILGAFGVTAHAAANELWTARGGFIVTQECISTPVIPIYIAAICAYAPTWRRLLTGVIATLPLFTALGVARLLVVALPDAAGSPLFFVHAFYQLLLGAVVVTAAALWRHGGRTATGYAAAGALAGVMFVYLVGGLYTRVIGYPIRGPLEDPQGALAILPAFQIGLYLALSVAALAACWWRRFLVGLAALGATQAAGFAALYALTTYPDLALHVRDVRAWTVAAPVLIFAAVVRGDAARR